MARTAGELEALARQLLAEVEALTRHAGGRVAAEPMLRELELLSALLQRYAPRQIPPDSLEIEVRLERVRTQLVQEREYLRWMQTRPVGRVVAYQLLWLTAMALLVFSWWNHQQRWQLHLPREVEVLIGCMLWGAAGSCFSSVIAMVRRTADRTLLPEYETWHLMKPLVGAFVGCLVYLILAGGIHFFNPADTGIPSTAYGAFAAVADRAWVAYLLSALMGYQERSFFMKVELVIKVLLGLHTAPPPPPPSTGAPGTCCCHYACHCQPPPSHGVPPPPPPEDPEWG